MTLRWKLVGVCRSMLKNRSVRHLNVNVIKVIWFTLKAFSSPIICSGPHVEGPPPSARIKKKKLLRTVLHVCSGRL